MADQQGKENKLSHMDALLKLNDTTHFVEKGEGSASNPPDKKQKATSVGENTKPKRPRKVAATKKSKPEDAPAPAAATVAKLNVIDQALLDNESYPWMNVAPNATDLLTIACPLELKLLLANIARRLPDETMRSVTISALIRELRPLAKKFGLPLPPSMPSDDE